MAALDLAAALAEGRKHVANLLSEWSPISGEAIKRDARAWLDATMPPSKKWLARPYEATDWKETDIEPTDELRRFLQFRPNSNGPIVERNTTRDVVFLQEAARFFDLRAASAKEDSEHQASAHNAAGCRRIAARLQALS